ncbi:MAG: cytochrome c oxidase subunit 3 [Planctomycetota bacterium]|jgi:cytochrome c oxidase subunit 3|nr:cytochrome c oxidase subunit 3 [Planctomycetota bacterium]
MAATSDATVDPADGATRRDAVEWRPSRGKVGVASLIAMESFFFGTFIVAFLFYIGKDVHGPTGATALDVGPVIVWSICLLSSSATVVAAVKALARGAKAAFEFWMGATLLLGGAFVYGTAVEWRGLMLDHELFISTNLFGSTYYGLVGFHAFHVVLGLLALGMIWTLSKLGHLRAVDAEKVELVSWYWHFVDVVWIFVFTSVYLFGTGIL